MGPEGRVGRLYLTSSIFASFHFSLFLCISCLFFTFPCSWLTRHASWISPIASGIFFIHTIIYFFLASFTDTSILRKGIEEELANQAVIIRAPRNHWCNRCQLHGLPHTFHCNWCNTCVEDFDHHCMWINNCVGRHNLQFFKPFVAFLNCYNVVVMIDCIRYLVINSHQPFGVEKICTIVVTVATAFYLLPLLLQLGSLLHNLWMAQCRCKRQGHTAHRKSSTSHQAWQWPSAPSVGHRSRSGVKSAMLKAQTQKAGKDLTIHRIPPFSRFRWTAPSSSPCGCPLDKPGEQRVDKAWHDFLTMVGKALLRKDPALGESAQHSAQEASKKKSSWHRDATDRSTEIPIEEMPESLQLLEEEPDVHWKCQLFLNRHAPSSPTGTLLSLSDI